MKYLVSLYFDDITNKQIMKYMEVTAEATGNDYMLSNHVLPHITISSFELDAREEYMVIKMLEHNLTVIFHNISSCKVQWVGYGAFMNSVLYLSPVLNEYLQTIMQRTYDSVRCVLR